MSSKITFSCNQYASFYKDAPLTKTYNMTVSGESLMELIEDFETFLKGCGYVFDGYLDIVPHEENTLQEDIPEQFPNGKVTISSNNGSVDSTTSFTTVTVPGHSQYFYDTERNK